MAVLRSVLFNTLFYANTIVWLVIILPTLLLPRVAIVWVAKAWCRTSLFLLRMIVGTRVEYRGLDNIPPGGLLVASKHQSFADILAVMPLFRDPTFILKRELTWIPFFGWYLLKAGMIPVDRSKGVGALADMNKRATAEIERGRQVLIFPEGTRRPPGAEPAYKFGVAHLYRTFDVPCLPVALNSGYFWPRRSMALRPGTLIVDVLPPMPARIERSAFARDLQEQIEAASNRLLAEAAGGASYRGPDGI